MNIAVIDDGVNRDSIKGCLFSYCVVGATIISDNTFVDKNSHGTICSKIIERNGDFDQLISLRVLDDNDEGSVEKLCVALEWCLLQNIDVINLSIGVTAFEMRGSFFCRLWQVCFKLNKRGTIIVAAKSNNNLETIPADFPTVISVGSISFYNLLYNNSCTDILTSGTLKKMLDGTLNLDERGNSFACAFYTAYLSKRKKTRKFSLFNKIPILRYSNVNIKYIAPFSNVSVVGKVNSRIESILIVKDENVCVGKTYMLDSILIVNSFPLYYIKDFNNKVILWDRKIPICIKIMYELFGIKYCENNHKRYKHLFNCNISTEVPIIHIHGVFCDQFVFSTGLIRLLNRYGYRVSLISNIEYSYLLGCNYFKKITHSVIRNVTRHDFSNIVILCDDRNEFLSSDMDVEIVNDQVIIDRKKTFNKKNSRICFQYIIDYFERSNNEKT